MTDFNPISNSGMEAPVVPTQPPVRQPSVHEQVAASKAPQKPAESQSSVSDYTVRYHVQDNQVSVRIIDGQGRTVRTVPASELLHALRQDTLAPRVNFLG